MTAWEERVEMTVFLPDPPKLRDVVTVVIAGKSKAFEVVLVEEFRGQGMPAQYEIHLIRAPVGLEEVVS